MNAVEIEQAVSQLAEAPFDGPEFPYAFLQAFGNKETTLRKLRAGNTNKSDVSGVLQTNNIHIAVAPAGQVGAVLQTLRNSPATAKAKAKFILATDGDTLEAEDLVSGETIVCDYGDFPNHFGFFLPLAGITTVKQIRESSFDIRATSRLNRLYVELLKDNKDWAKDPTAMNHFMARLIFCFFAEDTDIFQGTQLFTSTIEKMSDRDSTNTHEVMSEIFRAMNTHHTRRGADLPRWAAAFPYVNGGLFAGETKTPRFSRIARSFLVHIGNLDWRKINPDIFGSMIQAVADDEERGALGMHYTSVPNILKVLNPLFLDDLRAQLEAAGDSPAKLRNLRKRLARIRVFDPACGSGNFLVISYKELRAIEAEINRRLGDQDRRTEIRLTNFRGIELREFPAEIARLALIIAEYQCDVLYRGQKEALLEFLPLDSDNWITCGNALRLDWLSICPPTGSVVKHKSDDLLQTPLDQPEIDFENEGGETYICGNPPYKGNADQTKQQKADIEACFKGSDVKWKSLDYICGWFWKGRDYLRVCNSKFAFVSTNSISQGQNIPFFWQDFLSEDISIYFAERSFLWRNLATKNAGVTVVIVGCARDGDRPKKIVDGEQVYMVDNINPYLVAGPDVFVEKTSRQISSLPKMVKGNYYGLSEGLLMPYSEMAELAAEGVSGNNLRIFKGGAELVRGSLRACLWFPGETVPEQAAAIEQVRERIAAVEAARRASPDAMAVGMAERPHQFREMLSAKKWSIAVPNVSSINRPYLPVTLETADVVFPNTAFAVYDGPTYVLSVIASKLHLVWITTVCGRLRSDFRYSNTIGYNTFPVPALTEKNKADLTRCAEDILLAREAHFPKTIADLYDPEKMPDDLLAAHERNDEVLERIYIGRRFRNDTERLEKLFELYTKMAANSQASAGRTKRARA